MLIPAALIPLFLIVKPLMFAVPFSKMYITSPLFLPSMIVVAASSPIRLIVLFISMFS